MKKLLTIFILACVFSGTAATLFEDNFESGNLDSWILNDPTHWDNSLLTPITGLHSLQHHNIGIESESTIYTSTPFDLTGGTTVWRFNLKNGDWDPSSANRFWVYLTGLTNGYVAGVNLTGTDDLLKLWRITNGSVDAELISSSLDWNANTTAGIEVQRSPTGTWTLLFDNNGGFNSLTVAGTTTDTTYTESSEFGLLFDFSSTRAGKLWMDDVLITQTILTNEPPVLNSIGNQSVFEDQTLSFTVTASDPVDNDPVTLSATNLPPGATFSTNGLFVWSNAAPIGAYSTTFYATDKDGTDSETITITVIQKPLLLISEIADPAGTGGGEYRFVELYNAGSNAIDLTAGNWYLCRHNNGETWYRAALTGTIASGETYLIASSSSSFFEAYGFYPDQSDTTVDGNGNDSYSLYYDGDYSSGVLVDIYGEQYTDGTGTDWDYTDSRVVRRENVTEPNPTWTASEWVIIPDTAFSGMTPGVRQSLPQFDNLHDQFVIRGNPLSFAVTASDPIDGDPVTLNASTLPTGAVFTNGVFTWDNAVPLGIYTVTFLAADKDGTTEKKVTITVFETPLLIISEVADPDDVTDENGEEEEDGSLFRFVELYNAGTNAIDLAADNWHLSRQINGGSWDDIALTGSIAVASTWVVAFSAADFEDGFGFAPDQESRDISGNGDDAYVLYYGGDHLSGALVDIYGELDTDGSGTAWEYENGYVERKGTVTSPNSTWTKSEWIIHSGDKNGTTPGVHGPLPEFQAPESSFVFLGDNLSLTVTAVNTVRTDVITLTATNLPAGATFPTRIGTNTVSSTLSWNSPTGGTYIIMFSAAGEVGTTTKSIPVTVSGSTAIEGKFYGWDYDTIVKLENGQFWQRTGGALGTLDTYLRNPNVTVTNYLSSGKYQMFVEDLSYATVKQIDVMDSEVTNAFTGLHSGNFYQLKNGTSWKQISSSDNVSSTADSVTAWLWMNGTDQMMDFYDRDNLLIGTCEVIAIVPPEDGAVHSTINGYFRGWNYKRVFALSNGQFWQQISSDSTVETLYRPVVTITNWLQSGIWRMVVDGLENTPTDVRVQQLTNVTGTAISGQFYGFGKDGIFAMQNGSWWKQTSLETSASERSNPDVLIWNENGLDYIEMPDEGHTVNAEKLNVLQESIVTNTFAGLHYGNTYQLGNSTNWLQISFENMSTNISNPNVMLWTEGSKTYLLARGARDISIGTCTVADPAEDTDHDGIGNADEIIAGTDLMNASSLFQIAEQARTQEGYYVLTWPAVEGRVYTIEWAPTLTNVFQPLETEIVWPQNCWTDTVHSVESEGFYRVRVRLDE